MRGEIPAKSEAAAHRLFRVEKISTVKPPSLCIAPLPWPPRRDSHFAMVFFEEAGQIGRGTMQNPLRRLFLDVSPLHSLGVRKDGETMTKPWDSLWLNRVWKCLIKSLRVSLFLYFFY